MSELLKVLGNSTPNHEEREAVLGEARIVPIQNGFRLQSTEGYVVEVWKYAFNWRLVVLLPNQQITVEHGYCYFGRGLDSLARAVAAGLEWVDPLHRHPEGFDKQAF